MPLNAVIVTIGLLILIEGVAGIIYGGQYRSFPPAFSITGIKIGSFALGIGRADVFTAAAVLLLEQRGLLNVQDPIAKFISELANVKVGVENGGEGGKA